ncbi:MAG TPA: membrane protein insertase YidC [Candidatus Eisenbacteria bacterium]|nr:membrane protein insertase YidC [Candidatus Eisenbacteria bacterium]
MEKRAFLAVALSLLVLVLYQEWLTRQYGTAPPPVPKHEEVKSPSAAPPSPPLSTSKPETPSVESPLSQEAREVRVETDEYVALWTSRGGRLKSLVLKDHRTSGAENSPPYEMVRQAPGVPLPLGLQWNEAALVNDANVVYSIEGSDLQLSGAATGTLTFTGRSPGGAVLTKKLTFTGARYPIELEVAARRADGTPFVPAVMLTTPKDQVQPDAHFEGLVALVDNKIKRVPLDDLAKGVEFAGDIGWAGFGQTYFLMALVSDNGAGHRLTAQPLGQAIAMSIAEQPQRPPTGRYTLFAGPKQIDVLQSLGKGLERSIDFGYFAFIAIPFIYVLHFSHQFTGSYGIDIIILTVLIKLVLAPLTHKSMVSMKQMQKLQPQMERLKEKYKNDREKLNKEIMEMYRRHGVNPLGGCLPMLLQFPVFIGLYNALSTPIELRHASFLWIKDLSRPDWESLPFTIGSWHFGVPVLTILMGASMFIQQWMTPTAGDPNQRKMMLMMPLVFTVMFVTFPAGLTIYWLVNNILSIAQQYWINRSDA